MTRRIDTRALLARVDIAALIGAAVPLRPAGAEFVACCPFHEERTPSFTVSPAKGFWHCFGCGANGDAIDWLMRTRGLDFREACAVLGAETRDVTAGTAQPAVRERLLSYARTDWLPLAPVPPDAPALRDERGRVRAWNPKRQRETVYRPSAVYTYRGAAGELLGYVLRVDLRGGGKFMPQITWCVGSDGSQRWCLRPFHSPRPLYGLDTLAAKPATPVLVVEGEKVADVAARALPMYAVVAWPGGVHGVRHVDFAPLAGRDVVLWPDADGPGRVAMIGNVDRRGVVCEGAAQRAWRAGARSLRYVDVGGVPPGWDIADALAPGTAAWSPQQLAAWAAARVVDVDVVAPGDEVAA